MMYIQHPFWTFGNSNVVIKGHFMVFHIYFSRSPKLGYIFNLSLQREKLKNWATKEFIQVLSIIHPMLKKL